MWAVIPSAFESRARRLIESQLKFTSAENKPLNNVIVAGN